jgi:hypothetical protein
MENSTIESTVASRPTRDRWLGSLIVSIVINVACLILFPVSLTDGLTLRLAVICGVPALWGCYALLFFRTRRERFVGYAAFVPAIVWLAAIADLLSSYGWAGL